jgi:hypothetical protein
LVEISFAVNGDEDWLNCGEAVRASSQRERGREGQRWGLGTAKGQRRYGAFVLTRRSGLPCGALGMLLSLAAGMFGFPATLHAWLCSGKGHGERAQEAKREQRR